MVSGIAAIKQIKTAEPSRESTLLIGGCCRCGGGNAILLSSLWSGVRWFSVCARVQYTIIEVIETISGIYIGAADAEHEYCEYCEFHLSNPPSHHEVRQRFGDDFVDLAASSVEVV